jgi:hypothetical protein
MSVRGPPNRNMSTVMSTWVATFGAVVVFVTKIASGARTGIARTDRDCLGPGAARWPRVQASLGIDRERDPPRPAITIQRTAPADRPNLFCAHHRRGNLPVPLLDRRATKRARTPARSARLGRFHRAGGITPVKHGARPAVRTGNPSLSPRGAHSAVGRIRAWARNPGSRASSSSTVLLVGGQAAVRLEAVEWQAQRACERGERRVRAVGAADAMGEQRRKHSRNSRGTGTVGGYEPTTVLCKRLCRTPSPGAF